MDRLIKSRGLLRASITRTINEVGIELAKSNDERDRLKIMGKLQKLEEIMPELIIMDQSILDDMLDKDTPENVYGEESLRAEEYRDNVRNCKIQINDFLHPDLNRGSSPTPSEASSQVSSASTHQEKKRNFKLPKIELKKFGGALSEWLGWWAQFSKIHEDDSLHTSDKFQYLVGCMLPGSKAEDLIKSYPPSEDNYPKVVEALQKRFGQEEMLQEVYVREMLKLALNNAKTKEKGSLARMFNKLESHLRSLESLGVSPQNMATFLYPMVESSLSEDTLVAWQRSSNFGKQDLEGDHPKTKMDFLLEFLRKEVQNEEQRALVRGNLEGADRKDVRAKVKSTQDSDIPTAAGLHIGQGCSCIICEKNHQSHECFKLDKLDYEGKKSIIKDKKGCSTCLRPQHGTSKCKGWLRCSGCSGKHYHVMCPENPKNKKKPEMAVQINNSRDNTQEETTGVHSNFVRNGLFLLKTLVVKLMTPNGLMPLRVLFDDGSQRSYIRKEVVDLAQCQQVGTISERNSLFGGVVTGAEQREIYKVPLQSVDGKTLKSLEFRAKGRIACNIPRIPFGDWSKELAKKKIWLSDTQFASQGEEIDVLIGVDLETLLETGKMIKLKCGLMATETIFGWTIKGPVSHGTASAMTVSSLMVTNSTPHQLWDLEFLGIRDPVEIQSIKDKEAEVQSHFLETVTRNEEGRYCVRLPWTDGQQQIPDNKVVAAKRLASATNKLKKDGRFKEYDHVFKTWEKEGFIEEIRAEDGDACHYLPHRPVYKEDSSTTPVRPVFDASCKVGRNPSLNECLEKGPNYIELIPSVMLRFRENKIGVISDIRKAFQMIDVSESDQNYLRFLWWEDEHCVNHKIYRHKRVVFGVNCSPFLLGAVIAHHLSQIQSNGKEIAEKLLKSLYVDNCVTSVDSHAEYEEFKDYAIKIMDSAKMELRQWEFGPTEGNGDEPTQPSSKLSTTTPVLGMVWDKISDTLRCDTTPEIPEKLTKRTLLSTIQKIYDPMGFLSPAMISPKLLLQETWERDREIDQGPSVPEWDEKLSPEAEARFYKWIAEVKSLEEIRIPRNMTGGEFSRQLWKLHVFCDASKYAYAAIVFLRVDGLEGVSVQLMQAKARVAPLKKMTIPRLELMGCVIGARLAHSIQDALSLEIPTYYWTDSTTALAWIRRNDDWGTFVGNRVREICRLSQPENWRHVPGSCNPADLPSRGCTPQELKSSKWWEGPAWLKLYPSEWPSGEIIEDEDAIIQERKRSAVVLINSEVSYPFMPYRSFQENVQFVAEGRRLVNCLRAKSSNNSPLTVDELNSAERKMWQLVQQESFPMMSKTSNKQRDGTCGLDLEEDEDGILRVKTRLLYREDSEDFRKPILLPKDHPLVHQLILWEHRNNSHGGIQFLMSHLREKYWIINSRQTIRKLLKSCINCQRFRAKPPVVSVAPLPENRVKTAKIFEVTGVDLAGPLFLKDGTKVWIVLFTCAIYRGIHLELVESLSTESFLLALSRFISRRGRPSIIYSDNGTNFVGANNLFSKIEWDKVSREGRLSRIQWVFNPPTAAWWGGFWERLVQSVKQLLRRILGQKRLDYFQMLTCLTEVEAVINARPLTVVTEDSTDLIPLTPSMFLQEVSESRCPEIMALNSDDLRAKYKGMLVLKEELKQRFRKEYLGLLINKNLGKHPREFRVGEVVLIETDNKKRLLWPMGRVEELIPGRDGKIRVARVKTMNGILLRPLQRLFPLEVSIPEENIVVSPEVMKKAKKAKENAAVVQDEEPEVFSRRGRKLKKPDRFMAEC